MKLANGHDIDDAEADWLVSPAVLFQSEPDMIPTRRFCELTGELAEPSRRDHVRFALKENGRTD